MVFSFKKEGVKNGKIVQTIKSLENAIDLFDFIVEFPVGVSLFYVALRIIGASGVVGVSSIVLNMLSGLIIFSWVKEAERKLKRKERIVDETPNNNETASKPTNPATEFFEKHKKLYYVKKIKNEVIPFYLNLINKMYVHTFVGILIITIILLFAYNLAIFVKREFNLLFEAKLLILFVICTILDYFDYAIDIFEIEEMRRELKRLSSLSDEELSEILVFSEHE